MPDEYRIETLADFLKVPKEKWPELFRDFGTWLAIMAKQAELEAAYREALGPGVSLLPSFIWADDGVAGITQTVLTCDGEEVGRVKHA